MSAPSFHATPGGTRLPLPAGWASAALAGSLLGRGIRVCLGVLLLLAGGRARARADLRFSKTAVQAGEARSGVPLVQEFRFVNEGPETVELLEARAGCGCLTPRLTRRLYGPGEEGAVVLEVNTLGQPAGAHTWKVQLRYRRGSAVTELPLELSARVVTEVTVQPAALTLFTEAAVGQEVVLTDLRPRPLEVTAVRTSSPRLTAAPAGPPRDGPGGRVFRFQVEAAADCPEGRHEEALDIYTGDALYGHLRVPVTIVRRGRPRLAALPPEVTVRAAPGAPLPSQLLRVRDAQGEPVVIAEVTADDPAVVCRWAAGPDHLATVRVQIERQGLRGSELHSAIHIRLAGPVRETLTIPVTCTVE